MSSDKNYTDLNKRNPALWYVNDIIIKQENAIYNHKIQNDPLTSTKPIASDFNFTEVKNTPVHKYYMHAYLDDTSTGTKINKAEGVKKNSTKKRSVNPDKWKQNILKQKRAKGLSYVTKTGKVIEAKTLQPITMTCGEKCLFRCNDKINYETRLEINRRYWELASYQRQRDFLDHTIQEVKCASKKSLDSSRRNKTLLYFLNDIRVCKKFFLSTLNIGEKTVLYCKNKLDDSGIDKRGSTKNAAKISQETLDMISAHIQSFPTEVPPHSRKSTQRKYLSGYYSIQKMFNLFLEANPTTNVKYHTYRKIFNTEFNLSFLKTEKVCKQCKPHEKNQATCT